MLVFGILLPLGLVALTGCGVLARDTPAEPQSPRTNPALGIQWVRVEGGRFMMGTPDGEEPRYDPEGPQREVEVSGFWMGATEVTNAQYNAFLRDMEARGGEPWERVRGSGAMHPGLDASFKGDAQPVVCVSWEDAMAFCEWVGRGVTLPTEAQWEYACRAGGKGRFCFGNDAARLGDYAWYVANANGVTHPVAGKKANAFGLYDMHGNVWEWCADRYSEEYPRSKPAAGADRVDRGGAWDDTAGLCRSANWDWNAPTLRNATLGFRLVAPFAP